MGKQGRLKILIFFADKLCYTNFARGMELNTSLMPTVMRVKSLTSACCLAHIIPQL